MLILVLKDKGMNMTLNEFRLQRNLTYGQLARLIGVNHPRMAQRWCLDFDDPDRQIPIKYMEAILTVTQGAVTPNDFFIRRD
tara:strand:+ start:1801 stop:2046 length:246 start_codon:yes stop_codon:yes gene_type:complete